MTDHAAINRFLRARLDEETATLQAAPPGPWHADGAGSIVAADGSRVIPSVGGAIDGRVSRWPEPPTTAVVTAWHPARLLHEIEAKRELLRDLEQTEFTLSTAGPGTPPHDLMTGAVNTLRRLVQQQAALYATHPDYPPA